MDSEQQKSNVSLRSAYIEVLGGVSACSPRRYENSLQAIGRMVGRTVDDVLRAEIRVIEESLPCQID